MPRMSAPTNIRAIQHGALRSGDFALRLAVTSKPEKIEGGAA